MAGPSKPTFSKETVVLGCYKDYSLKDVKKLVVRKLKYPFYAGRKYQCPVCGANLSKFKPAWKSLERELSTFIYPIDSFETFNRTELVCPSCDASDRDRLCALYIKQKLGKLPQDDKPMFLDFAPNLGISCWMRGFGNIEYRSLDLFRRNVDEKVDIQDMPQFPDNSVGGFICSHVLEHVPDDAAAMKELYRILKSGGFGVVMVPLIRDVMKTQEDPSHTTEELRKKHYAQGDHLRLYGISDFMEKLQKVGFQVQRLGMDYFGQDTFGRSGITECSALYVVTKP